MGELAVMQYITDVFPYWHYLPNDEPKEKGTYLIYCDDYSCAGGPKPYYVIATYDGEWWFPGYAWNKEDLVIKAWQAMPIAPRRNKNGTV